MEAMLDGLESVFHYVLCTAGWALNMFDNAANCLVIDACHGRTAIGGIWVVVATAISTGEFVPLVTGYVADSESYAMWTHVLAQVREFGFVDRPSLSICSDRDKGLLKAVAEQFPLCVGAGGHRACALHLMRNAQHHAGQSTSALESFGCGLAIMTELHEYTKQLDELTARVSCQMHCFSS